MKRMDSIGGVVTIEMTSADISAVLSAIADAGITLHQIQMMSELTVHLTVSRQDFKNLRRILLRRGERIRIIKRGGMYWGIMNLLRRPVFVFGLGILVVLALILPNRVLFITVDGNGRIPSKRIIEQAQNYGVYFGADRRSIRSEKIKNGLLGSIDELQWVGVTTDGCVARIHVRERSQPELPSQDPAVSSIVASQDGIIRSVTASRGTALCKVGQAVTKGQVLISAYTDCGLTIRADQAEGEVIAQTIRKMTAVTPEIQLTKGAETGIEKKFSLIIGKKRINFYKDSGILDTTCVKMYSEKYITLPGAFSLPVIVLEETWIYYEVTETETTGAESVLLDFSQRYLASQMIAGQILHRSETVDGCRMEGQYACLEMIGQVRYEESIPQNEDR